MMPSCSLRNATSTALLTCLMASFGAMGQSPLPSLDLPDQEIVQIYTANWENSLRPAQEPLPDPGTPAPEPNEEPSRPWRVDLSGHYPGWYPGVDMKHMAAAYLACEKNLPLVLRAWDLTISSKYLLPDGSVRPMTFHDNPHNVVPETTEDESVVYYPLRLTANIDTLLLGDMIFRFSQDRTWLTANLPVLRTVAGFIEAWIDSEGLLHSDSYDLDQVYREIDGVANAAAILAFRRLADLEQVAGNSEKGQRLRSVAARIAAGVEKHLWSEKEGYYLEHLAYNSVASTSRPDVTVTASTELDPDHAAGRAIDGIRGTGLDAFGAGSGAAGQNEWAAKDETVGAWVKIDFAAPTLIAGAILFNRTDAQIPASERFAAGRLEFSDASAPVDVSFNGLDVSRAVTAFDARVVTWIKFTGTRMRAEGGRNAGLAEFMVLPAEKPYRAYTHGMTDTNLALVAFDAVEEGRATKVWNYFQKHQRSFYEVDGLFAPTWIAEKAETYGPGDLNKRAPHKDCVAMARIWRYDALTRHRMDDGEGLYRTITYANTLFARPSGGGAGYFAERYGLGRFQPGDEAQATVPKYTEYPAVYNSTIVQQTLLGLDVDAWGTITIAPCVPKNWYEVGFGQEGCGLLMHRDIGFRYAAKSVTGWVSGAPGPQKIQLRLPPLLTDAPWALRAGDVELGYEREGDWVTFEVNVPPEGRVSYAIR